MIMRIFEYKLLQERLVIILILAGWDVNETSQTRLDKEKFHYSDVMMSAIAS